MSEFEEKRRQVRIERAKAAIRRGEEYYGTHRHQSAAIVIRDLTDMLKETVNEIQFPSATGDSQYG